MMVLTGFCVWSQPSFLDRQRRTTYLDFIDDVERVLIAGIREDDLDKTVGHAIAGRLALESVAEVRIRVLDSGVSA